MRRTEKRDLPTKPSGEVNPIYFQVTAEGLDPKWFRTPNDRQALELLQLLATFATNEGELGFAGSIDALAALVGAAWWDSELELVTAKPKRGGSWMDFGAEVLEELHEEGFGGASHVAPWAAEIAKRLASVVVGTEDVLGNGEAPKASGT